MYWQQMDPTSDIILQVAKIINMAQEITKFLFSAPQMPD